MKITLLGYMGCGKSTIGKALSNSLGLSFIDLDAYIEVREGTSITNIFTEKGEIYFRRKESEYLKELYTNSEYQIISLGGGTPCYGNNMEVVNNYSVSIYLQNSIRELSERLYKEKSHRPLLANISSKEALTNYIGAHIFERSNYYKKANYEFACEGVSVLEIVEKLKSYTKTA